MFDFNGNESAIDPRDKEYTELREKLIGAKKDIVLMYYRFIRMSMEDEFEYQLIELKKRFKDNPEDVVSELNSLKVICDNFNLRDIRSSLERAISLSQGFI